MCKFGDTFSWAEILFYSWDVIGYITQEILIILMKIKGLNWTVENYEFVNVHMKVTQKDSLSISTSDLLRFIIYQTS